MNAEEVKRLGEIEARLVAATKGRNGYTHAIMPDGLTIDEYDNSGGTIAQCARPDVAELFGNAASDLWFLLDLVRSREVDTRN